MKKLFKFCKQIFDESGKDKTGILSAAFAYIAIFSMGPLLLVVISIAGFIYGDQAANGKLLHSLSNVIGADTAKAVQDVIVHTNQTKSGALALIIGLGGLLLAAISLTNQLQVSFNQIFKAVPDPASGFKNTIYTKVKNIGLLLFGGVCIAFSFILSTIIIGLGKHAQELLSLPYVTLELLNSILSFGIFVFALYLIYSYLPDVVIPKRLILKTAFIVGALFLIGKVALAFVIGNNGAVSAYGAAASLVTLLLWFYYTGLILMWGAEGIKIHGENKNLVFPPKKFTLKRNIINIDTKNDLKGRFIQTLTTEIKRDLRKTKK